VIDPKPIPRWVNAASLADEVETALRAERPETSLRDLVYRWFDRGLDEGEVLSILLDCRDSLRRHGRGADENVVDEIISYVEGWCGPDSRIRRTTVVDSGQ
jgi:hypothetical protein